MKRALLLMIFAMASCKKHEAVQQAAPVETAPATVAATAPSVSVTADPSASAAPHEHTAAELEAEKQAARAKAIEEAAQFGMIGILGAHDAGSPSLFERDDFGSNGGLGLSGIGEGGGHSEGIGLGNIGTIGRPTASDGGIRTMTRPPSIRQGAITVNGRLPPEVIQRIARQSFGRYRLCYENGLRSNPSLQGRVVVKYTIDRDGSVKGTPTDGGSDLPDQGVVQCVIRAFQSLSYPQPEGGIVTVTYPLIMSPSS